LGGEDAAQLEDFQNIFELIYQIKLKLLFAAAPGVYMATPGGNLTRVTPQTVKLTYFRKVLNEADYLLGSPYQLWVSKPNLANLTSKAHPQCNVDRAAPRFLKGFGILPAESAQGIWESYVVEE